MTNFAFQSDMQRIHQAAATGKVSSYAIARDSLLCHLKHGQMKGLTGREFAHGCSNPVLPEFSETVAEFNDIIATFMAKRRRA